ncbi:unnamed protein product [Mytilus edulis]|uniref:Uncharacterized protein n=1 Tax=Mytilus edulis TaxID=6550 RepID=A0A8S3QTE0_MYTED|nr:unnamed protein product [Mytilus edulis]
MATTTKKTHTRKINIEKYGAVKITEWRPKTSLQGLDNTIADGMKGIDNLEKIVLDSLTDLVPRTDIVPLSDENNSVIVVDNSQTAENNQVPDDNTDLNSTVVYERQNSRDSSSGGSSLTSPVSPLAELKVEAVNKVGRRKLLQSRYDLSKETLCQKESENKFNARGCIERKCENCGVDQLKDKILKWFQTNGTKEM